MRRLSFFRLVRFLVLPGMLLFTACGQPKSFEEQFGENISVENSSNTEPVKESEDPKTLSCEKFLNEQKEPRQKERVSDIVRKIETAFPAEFTSGLIAFLDHEELSGVLSPCELAAFDELSDIDPNIWGITLPKFPNETVALDQLVKITPLFTERKKLSPAFVSGALATALEKMLNDMEHETGRRLYVESGYRSKYYQGYLFLKTSRKYRSFAETVKHVELPGYSEHGMTEGGAVDFIAFDGISNEDASSFKSRKEYWWLERNAIKYGFSQPFEVANRFGMVAQPWHWTFNLSGLKTISNIPAPYGTTRINASDSWGEFIEALPLKPFENQAYFLYQESGKNAPYEDPVNTLAIVDIPVSSLQDTSRQILRLLAFFAEREGKAAAFSFPNKDESISFSSFLKEHPLATFDDFIRDLMFFSGNIRWDELLEEISLENVRVGDLIVQTDRTAQPPAGKSLIGSTGIVVGLAEDQEKEKYYLVASGSMPVTSFRISRATNGWQGLQGWFDLDGFRRRVKTNNVKFYRMEKFFDKVTGQESKEDS